MASLRPTVLLLVLACLFVSPVAAVDSTRVGAQGQADGIDWASADVRYVDSDGNGSVDTLHARLDFTRDGTEDAIVIHDPSGIETDGRWTDALDYDGDFVLYDVGDDGRADIGVKFAASEGNRAAEVIDYEANGTPYDVETAELLLGNSPPPVVEMRSAGPWVTRRGVSYDLRLSIRDPVRSSFSYGLFADVAQSVRTEVAVNDTDGDGVPDHEIRKVETDLPPSAGYIRTEVTANQGSEAVIAPDGGLLWPHLGSAENRSYTKPYGEAPPPIQVDWQNGTVARVGEFVASRGDEDNYFVYTPTHLTPGETAELEFEYPFAFYDLAADDDGRPELTIRAGHFGQGSRRGIVEWPTRSPTPVTEIRYAWDQNNDGRWDYKLGGVDTEPYRNVTEMGPYEFYSPGYEALPTWLRSRQWRAASFVVAPNGRRGTEGIYEGGFGTPRTRTVLGVQASIASAEQALGLKQSRQRLFESTSKGFRLEANGSYDARPKLYLSPVDGRWHLHGLSYGYWNESLRSREYVNSNDDPFVDEWRNASAGSTTRLLAADWGLVYVADGRIEAKRTALDRGRTVTRPPATPAEWRAFGDPVANVSKEPRPLGSLFDRQDGRAVSVARLDVSSTDVTGDEVRIYGTTTGDLSLGGTSVGADESVVVVVDRDGASVHRATPATPDLRSVTPSTEAPAVGERVVLGVDVANDGWTATENLTLTATIDGRQVANRTVVIDGKSTESVRLPVWVHGDAADVTVVAAVDDRTVERTIRIGTENRSLLPGYALSMSLVPHSALLGAAVLAIVSTLVILFREVIES